MKIKIEKSDIKGRVTIPSSKSMTIRALFCAALSMGESEVINPLVSDDTNAAAHVLTQIGVGITREKDVWQVTGGKFRVPKEPLDCGESATTLRFMTAVMSLIPGEHKLMGGPMLMKRPVRSLTEALGKLGVKVSTEGKTTPPATVKGGTFKGGNTEIAGNISSQFVSALLLIAPFTKQEVTIKLTTPLTSRPYVLMTLWCLKKFGINVRTTWDGFVVKRQRYQPARLKIEGDWSSASYFLALGAISEAGVQLDNLKTASLQGDRVMLDFLRNMGALVRVTGDSVTVSKDKLRAITADLSDCIDLLPAMAMLAALANGESVFIGIGRARIKESNRVSNIKEGLQKFGIQVSDNEDRLSIIGMQTPAKTDDEGSETSTEEKSAEEVSVETKEPVEIEIDSHGDHRLAMAFAMMGAALGKVTIEGAECVTKTFPDFWELFAKVGGEIKEID
jgi:3-phosphoshikimate 1-carboxyvinyltransferase